MWNVTCTLREQHARLVAMEDVELQEKMQLL